MDDDKGHKNNKKNGFLLALLVLFFVIIGGLVAGIVFINTRNNETDGNAQGDATDSYTPELTKEEMIYNSLLDSVESYKDNLGEMALRYCNDQINSLANEEDVFNVVRPCSAFMLEYNLPNEAISVLDHIDSAKASTAELLTVYLDYGSAYEKLGNTAKSSEFNNKYQELKNSQPGGL